MNARQLKEKLLKLSDAGFNVNSLKGLSGECVAFLRSTEGHADENYAAVYAMNCVFADALAILDDEQFPSADVHACRQAAIWPLVLAVIDSGGGAKAVGAFAKGVYPS